MDTVYLRVNSENPDEAILKKAAELIRKGELVVFPTETVYGLGANTFDETAIMKIFEAKGRPQDNPLIVHISTMEMLKQIVSQDVESFSALMDLVWPGPVTLIFEKSKEIPDSVTAGLKSVAVRFPSHRVAQELIRLSGVPIAAPSANLSGRPSPTMEEHVIEDMDERASCTILSGSTVFGLESTIIDLSRGRPSLLRPGPIDPDQLKGVLPDLLVPDFVSGRKEYLGDPMSPGLKYRHYSPDIPLILVEGETGMIVAKVGIVAGRKKSLVLCSEEMKDYYPVQVKKVVLGSRDNLLEVASNLFKELRNKENMEYSQIIAEPFPETGVGLAIMNRLRKAAWKIERA